MCLIQWDIYFLYCTITRSESKLSSEQRQTQEFFLDLPSTSSPDAVAALYRNLSLLTLNCEENILSYYRLFISNGSFQMKTSRISILLPGLSCATCWEAGVPVQYWMLCSKDVPCWSFHYGTSTVKLLKSKLQSVSSLGSLSLPGEPVQLRLRLPGFQSTAQMTRYPFTTGSNEDSLLHDFSRRALPPTSLKWTRFLFFQNSSHLRGPDFWPPKIHELDSNQISELADVSGKLSATHGIVAANISSLHPEFFQIALPTLHVAMAGVPQALLSLFIIIVEDIWLSIYYFCACSLLASSVYMITGFVVFLAL